jgi:hypothetical protein
MITTAIHSLDMSAEAQLRTVFEPVIAAWASRNAHHNPRETTGLARVEALLTAVRGAISALAKRDDRGLGARDYLYSLRDKLTDSRAAHLSIGSELDGPKGIALLARYEAALVAHANAATALRLAPPDRDIVREKRIDLDLADSVLGAVNREIIALRDASTLPRECYADRQSDALIKLLEDARGDSVLLRRAAERDGAEPKMRTIELALYQGAAVERASGNAGGQTRAEAQRRLSLSVCWETGHQIFEYRHKRYLETLELTEGAAHAAE